MKPGPIIPSNYRVQAPPVSAFLLFLNPRFGGLMTMTTYISDLSKAECLWRLQAHTGRGLWTQWAEGTISANLRGERFRLFASGPVNVRNSFAPFFYGRLEEVGGKTRIRGRFRLHPVTRVFLLVWFGGLAAMAALLLFLPASSWAGGARPPAFMFLGPVVMALLGFGFVRLCRWLARGQVESIRSFLVRELRAQPCGERADGVSVRCGEKT